MNTVMMMMIIMMAARMTKIVIKKTMTTMTLRLWIVDCVRMDDLRSCLDQKVVKLQKSSKASLTNQPNDQPTNQPTHQPSDILVVSYRVARMRLKTNVAHSYFLLFVDTHVIY